MRKLIPCSQQGAAPHWPGQNPTWGYSRKEGIGTSVNRESRVWFSLAGGMLTEVYYPTIDCPNLKQMQFYLLSKDGLEGEREMLREVEWQEKTLLFRQYNTSRNHTLRLRKTTIAHPRENVVLVRVQLEPLVGELEDYRLFLYIDPHIKNSGGHDTIFQAKHCHESAGGEKCGFGKRCVVRTEVADCIIAAEDEINMALATTLPWKGAKVGYVGATDGLKDLKEHGELGREYTYAGRGNVGATVELSLENPEFTVALAFGSDAEEAADLAFASLAEDFEDLEAEYCQGWEDYCHSLNDLGGQATALYYQSAMVLKTLEDKQYPGANVASLSIPWGEAWDDWNSGGYHLVWVRDLYQVAMAFLALGDRDAANRALEYILKYLQHPDGSVKQNAWVDGRIYWDNVQMDQVAYPLILGWWLERTDLYEKLSKSGAYLLAHGPYSPQERWEENSGYSPSSMAAQIAGLVCLAELAQKLGKDEEAARYLAKADLWQGQLEKFCLTETGPLADHPYFLRVASNGNPDSGAIIELANGHARFDEREITDAGFLELVRLGVKNPHDPAILNSLKVVDQYLSVDTPKGRSYYRYCHDGYGEPSKAELYRGAGKGRLWPLLTGERGHYELARGNRAGAEEALFAMEQFANEGLLLSEQVWEETGAGTGSATPLAWSHAEYIRLLASIVGGKVTDCPPPVAARYARKV